MFIHVTWDLTRPRAVTGHVKYILDAPVTVFKFKMPFMSVKSASSEFVIRKIKTMKGAVSKKQKCTEHFLCSQIISDGRASRADGEAFTSVELLFELKHGVAFQTYSWRNDTEWYTVSSPDAQALYPTALKHDHHVVHSTIRANRAFHVFGPGDKQSSPVFDGNEDDDDDDDCTSIVRVDFTPSSRLAFLTAGQNMCISIPDRAYAHIILRDGGPLFICSSSFSASRSGDVIYKYLGHVYRELWTKYPHLIDMPSYYATDDSWIIRGYTLLKASQMDSNRDYIDSWHGYVDIAPFLANYPPCRMFEDLYVYASWRMTGFGYIGTKAKQSALLVNSLDMMPHIEWLLTMPDIPLCTFVLLSTLKVKRSLPPVIFHPTGMKCHEYDASLSYNRDQHQIYMEFTSNTFRGELEVSVTEVGSTRTVHRVKVTEKKNKFIIACAEQKVEGRGGRKRKQEGARRTAWKNANYSVKTAVEFAQNTAQRKFWNSTLPISYVEIDPNQRALLVPRRVEAYMEWYLETLDQARFRKHNVCHLILAVSELFESIKQVKDEVLSNRVTCFLLVLVSDTALPVDVRVKIIEIFSKHNMDDKRLYFIRDTMTAYYTTARCEEIDILDAFVRFGYARMEDCQHKRQMLLDLAWRIDSDPEFERLGPCVQSVIENSEWEMTGDDFEDYMAKCQKEWISSRRKWNDFTQFQKISTSPLLRSIASKFSRPSTSISPSLSGIALVETKKSSSSASSSPSTSSKRSSAAPPRKRRRVSKKTTLNNNKVKTIQQHPDIHQFGITKKRIEDLLKEPETFERGEFLEAIISSGAAPSNGLLEPSVELFESLLTISPHQRGLFLYFVK
jgi:hypothetical protein